MATAHLLLEGKALRQSPFAHLKHEHELVRRALAVLQRIAAHVDMGCSFPTGDVECLLEFFSNFFHAVHEVKEADHLYPAVVLHGNDREAELAGGLLRDHDDTRELLHSLTLFGEPSGDPSGDFVGEERQGFVDSARTYVRRLSRLMHEEETSLFPIAQACLDADDQHGLLEVLHEMTSKFPSAAGWNKELQVLEATWGS